MSYDSTTFTATGATSTLSKNANETVSTITISGTYATVSFTVEGTYDGTNWEQVLVVSNKTGAVVTGGTSISPTDDTKVSWNVANSVNLVGLRLNVSAIASGTVTVKQFSNQPVSPVPYVVVTQAAGAFTNITASGTLAVTGASTLGTSVTLNGAVPLIMSGTTGQPEIQLTDNLADALSIEISGSTDLLTFATTNNAECVSPIGLRTRSSTAVAITGATTLTLADSGGIFTVSQAAAYDIDLPSPTTGPGCRYFFSLTAPGANNVTITVAGSAATFVGSIVSEGQIVVATGSTLTFATGASLLGDSIEIQSIATNLYHVRAIASALNGITVS